MGTVGFKIIDQTMVLTGNSMSDYININTLFGAVIVLAIVILIMLITYFVNIKPNLNNPSGITTHNYNSVDTVISQIDENEQEELVSDCELVAVITAAIYASMGDAVPANGLIVRSIRKTSSKKWMNA